MGSLGLPLADQAERHNNEPLCERLERFSHQFLRNTRSHRVADQGVLEAWSTIRTSSWLALSQMRLHGELMVAQVEYDRTTDDFGQIYSPVPGDTLQQPEKTSSNVDRYWTLLVLAPDRFFNDKNTSFPMAALSPGRIQAVGYSLGRLTQPGAELNLIGQGLERIADRWADFIIYFDYILDGGDSLMKPAEHDNLLFDDGAFSRSRRYFWAIDCLSEFEVCITDNITQWELYKAARVPSMTDLPEHDQRQLIFAERQYRVLQNQRELFRQKLALTKALRDAVCSVGLIDGAEADNWQLFNASAVIESRASTRLGENIKLLTFVSIFFLPLAFTTVSLPFSIPALSIDFNVRLWPIEYMSRRAEDISHSCTDKFSVSLECQRPILHDCAHICGNHRCLSNLSYHVQHQQLGSRLWPSIRQ